MNTKHLTGTRKFLALTYTFACIWCLIIATTLPVHSAEPYVESIVPGVVYREFVQEEGPRAIQVLEIRKNTASISLGVVLGGEYVMGIEPLTNLTKRVSSLERRVIAGINGDFYILRAEPFQGDPIGFCVVDGELISSPVDRSAIVFLEDGTPIIDCFSFKARTVRPDGKEFRISGINQSCPAHGLVLLTPRFNNLTRPQENAVVILAGPLHEPLSTRGAYTFAVREKRTGDIEIAIPPHRVILVGCGHGAGFLEHLSIGDRITCTIDVEPFPGEILHAVGGGPRLLRGGNISIEAEREGISTAFVDTRHPRTAFGFNNDSFFLVTVDGRQEVYSVGMSLTELAAFMKDLGADEAINLDGGGSTTMWVQGNVRNRPSDGNVRPIANAILLYNTLKRAEE